MTEFPDVVTVLQRAGERIARTGLIKGKLFEWAPGLSYTDTCRVCSFGAVNWALTGNPASPMCTQPAGDREAVYERFSEAELYLLDAIAQENPGWYGSSPSAGVPDFNDDPATTTEQVVHVFTVAARIAEQDMRAAA